MDVLIIAVDSCVFPLFFLLCVSFLLFFFLQIQIRIKTDITSRYWRKLLDFLFFLFFECHFTNSTPKKNFFEIFKSLMIDFHSLNSKSLCKRREIAASSLPTSKFQFKLRYPNKLRQASDNVAQVMHNFIRIFSIEITCFHYFLHFFFHYSWRITANMVHTSTIKWFIIIIAAVFISFQKNISFFCLKKCCC